MSCGKNAFWGVNFLHFALCLAVFCLTAHTPPRRSVWFCRDIISNLLFSRQQCCPADILSLCFSMLWLLVTVINGKIKQEHFPDTTGGTPRLLQLSPCTLRWWLCGLFFKLFLDSWESAYKFPSPSGSFRLLHSSVALEPRYTESVHFPSFAELPCKREISCNLVQFTCEKLQLLLIFTFSTCLSLFSVVSNLSIQLRGC